MAWRFNDQDARCQALTQALRQGEWAGALEQLSKLAHFWANDSQAPSWAGGRQLVPLLEGLIGFLNEAVPDTGQRRRLYRGWTLDPGRHGFHQGEGDP